MFYQYLLDKEQERLAKEASLLDMYHAAQPILAHIPHLVGGAVVGHIAQNQLAKKIVANTTNTGLYAKSFLNGTMGHNKQNVKDSVRLGLTRAAVPEVGIMSDHLNNFGKELRTHLANQGKTWANLPPHHHEFAQALAGGDSAKVTSMLSQHKDIGYLHNMAKTHIPGLEHALSSNKVTEKWKGTYFGKIAPNVLKKPSMEEVKNSISAGASRMSKPLSIGAEAVGNAGVFAADTGAGVGNLVKRFAGYPLNKSKHPILAKAQEFAANKLFSKPIENSFVKGLKGQQDTNFVKSVKSNIINPVMAQASDVANTAGLQGAKAVQTTKDSVTNAPSKVKQFLSQPQALFNSKWFNKK